MRAASKNRPLAGVGNLGNEEMERQVAADRVLFFATYNTLGLYFNHRQCEGEWNTCMLIH